MNRGFGLLLIIPALLGFFMSFASIAIATADYEEFEEYRLERTNNYATDAAMQEVIQSDDLEQDYTDTDQVVVYPNTARDTFLSVFALNYDIPITQDMLKNLSAEYLDVFIVVAYDGYYVFNRDGVGDDKFPTDYSSYAYLKQPFIYTDGDGKRYSFDMRFDKAYRLDENHVTLLDDKEFAALGLTPSVGMSLINQQLNKEINTRLELSLLNGSLGTVMIPEAATKVGMVNNAVEDVSVLAFVNNVNLTTAKCLNAFSIGGTKIKATRMIACYQRNNQKYYAYVDAFENVPNNLKPSRYEKGANVWAEHVVTSMEEAAKLGYSYDVELMESMKKG